MREINPLNKVKNMNYLVDPQSLVFRAVSRIAGFSEMVRDNEIPQWDLLETATQVAEEWTNDWDDDQGFGSSDGTYMLKDFIDTIISNFTNSVYKKSGYQTVFNPILSVEYKYSESELVSFEDNGQF